MLSRPLVRLVMMCMQCNILVRGPDDFVNEVESIFIA